MKQIITVFALFLIASLAHAQDVITLKTGGTIKAKVAEVGINEIKYYKAANLDGPVYISAKADIAQITYANGTRDVFSTAPVSVPSGNVAAVRQTVRVKRPVRRYRPYASYPVTLPHIDLGHHIDVSHHSSHHDGHHGSGHH